MKFKKEELIKSPLNYTGGKFRLLPKILPLFPDNIDTFVDLFGGAMNVCINIKANKIYGNDYINYLPELFNTWKNKSLEEINNHIDNRISEFGLSGTNKDGFEKFRDYYNEHRNIEDLFILVCHSFNYQIRFNNSQKYNGSFGKEASTMNKNIRKNLDIFVNRIKENNIDFVNKDFRELKINNLSADSMVYCDPPYLVSCGVYQDGKRGFKGWGQQDDLDLMNLLDNLNSKNVKFAMSNAFENKGEVNDILIEWSKKYNVHFLDMNYNSANYQRNNNHKTVEVLITNYNEEE
jgi:DNA adenine methylase Dam